MKIPVKHYSSQDTDAPQLTANDWGQTFILVLKACLVSGFSTGDTRKDPAGWSIANENEEFENVEFKTKIGAYKLKFEKFKSTVFKVNFINTLAEEEKNHLLFPFSIFQTNNSIYWDLVAYDEGFAIVIKTKQNNTAPSLFSMLYFSKTSGFETDSGIYLLSTFYNGNSGHVADKTVNNQFSGISENTNGYLNIIDRMIISKSINGIKKMVKPQLVLDYNNIRYKSSGNAANGELTFLNIFIGDNNSNSIVSNMPGLYSILNVYQSTTAEIEPTYIENVKELNSDITLFSNKKNGNYEVAINNTYALALNQWESIDDFNKSI